jgi:hypothetical protein
MNEQERNDLLVELKTTLTAVEKRLEKIEARLSARLCYTHDEKIKALEKITWTALLAAIGGVINSIWGIK